MSKASLSSDADTGVVPLAQAVTMQQDSVAAPAEPSTPQAPTKPAVQSPEEKKMSAEDLFNNTFSTCDVHILVTLGLADPRFADSGAKELDKTLYSPFRKGSAKDADKVIPAGVFRAPFISALQSVSLVNSSNILFLGKTKDVYSSLQTAVARLGEVCTNAFPIDPNQVVLPKEAEASSTDEEAAFDGNSIKFNDVVRITSWLGMDWNDKEAMEAPAAAHEATIHFYVNSGALYDSQDKLKAIRQVETTIRLLTDKYGQESTSVLLAVNLSSESMDDPEIRDLLGVLLEEQGYSMFTRQNMLENFNNYEFLPKSKKSITEDLLNPNSPNGDMLLIKVLQNEEAAAEDPEAAQ